MAVIGILGLLLWAGLIIGPLLALAASAIILVRSAGRPAPCLTGTGISGTEGEQTNEGYRGKRRLLSVFQGNNVLDTDQFPDGGTLSADDHFHRVMRRVTEGREYIR